MNDVPGLSVEWVGYQLSDESILRQLKTSLTTNRRRLKASPTTNRRDQSMESSSEIILVDVTDTSGVVYFYQHLGAAHSA